MAVVPTGGFRAARVPGGAAPAIEEEAPVARQFQRQTVDERQASETEKTFGIIVRREIERKEVASEATRRDPDVAARANQIAPWKGLPPRYVEENIGQYEEEIRADSIRAAMDRSLDLATFFGDERRAAVAHDDVDALERVTAPFNQVRDAAQLYQSPVTDPRAPYAAMGRFTARRPVGPVERTLSPDSATRAVIRQAADRNRRAREADGFLSRMGAFASAGLSAVESGLYSVGGALQEWDANTRLPWLSDEANERNRQKALAASGQLRERARVTREQDAVRGGTSWETVKAAPSIGNIGSFVAEQGVSSLPGMALTAINPFAFGASQAGNIGQQRAENNQTGDATISDVLIASPAAAASAVLERLGISKIFGATGRTVAGRVGQAAAGEGVTEFAQTAVEQAGGTVGTERGFDLADTLDQSFAAALAGAGTGGAIRSVQEGTTTIAKRVVEVVQARQGSAVVDKIMSDAADSKSRVRDPRMFEEFIQGMAQGTPLENMFIPAEAIRELYQSNGWDMGQDDDGIMSNLTDDFWQQVEAGVASGGDVVIPISAVAAHLAGTPVWEQLKGSVRVSPGGISMNEVNAFESEYADVVAKIGEDVRQAAEAERAAAEPRERVFDAVLGQAREAGFSVNAARAYADLWADRYETRAQRLGDGRSALDLFEQSFAGIRQDLPERVKPYRRGDGIDVLLNAIRTGAQPMTPRAKSLIETIVEGGGVNDDGGDIASMGGGSVVRGGIFGRARKSLIRDQAMDGQASMLPGGSTTNDYGLDSWAQRLQAQGFFGDLTERATVNDLLDAIGQELRGEPVYPSEAELDPVMQANNAILEAAEDLRQLLDNLGVDAATATRAEIDAALARWDAEGEAAFGFDQQGARGRIDFLADNRAAITLFESRDLSTLLHEGGHLWLEELRGDALSTVGQADASPQARKLFGDWEATKAWFKRNGIDVNDKDPIPTEAHELWARGMERYFMEGKAPSSSLSNAFSSFRAWLLRIYKVVRNLRSEIDDDVRKVFDRLLATDQAISWAIHEADERALFETVVPEGMSGPERMAYMELIEQSRTEAFDALLYRTMERVRRSRTARYQEEEAKVRAEVATDVAARPEFAALRLIRGVGVEHMPLDLDGVIARVGRDAVPLLPRGGPKAKTITANGVNPDIVAEQTGFPDGKTMLEALIGVEERRRELIAAGDKRTVQQETVDLETENRMRERHGDIFDDGSIEEEALELIQTDAGAERLASEVRQLSRAIDPKEADGPPTPLDVIRSYAERVVREGRIVDQATGAAVERHRKAKSKASREAERAYLNGDNVVALKAKQREMIASELWRAARGAKEQVDVIARRLDRFARTRNLKGMSQDYLDRIHEVLESYDLRPRSRDDIRERERFEEWRKKQAELGFEVFIPERLTLAGNKHFSRLTFEEIVAIDDTVQSLAHLGRQKMELLVEQEERRLEDMVERAEVAALKLPIRPFSDARNEERRILNEIDAGLVKIEFIADQMDGGNPNGVFNDVLVKGSTHAANEKERLQRQVVDPLAKMYLEMPKAQRKRLAERVTVPEFVTVNPETKETVSTTFTRAELLAVALNTGNSSNLDKMLIGETMSLPEGLRVRHGWTEDRVMAVLDRELSREDWLFVEAIWRQINTLWPDIERSEREISGVAPEKIEGRLVQTKYGTFQGGYYPMVYDPNRSQIAADNADDDAARLFGGIGRSVSTPKGHTITRTDAALPVHFSLERVLFNHINRVTTRIAYGRYARDVLQFSNHPKIRKLMNIHIGPEYHAQIKGWLQRQVNEASLDTAMLSGIERVFRQVRVNATMVGLGLRFTTMAAQLGGWANSAAEIGPKWMARGMRETATNMGKIRDFVFANSPEMAGRAEAFDRDVRTFYRDAGRKLRGRRQGRAHKILDGIQAAADAVGIDKIQAGAFWGIGMIDVYLVAMPTWVGAYRKAIEAEGMDVPQAIAFADKAVRKSQSAGRAKDLSSFQDSNEGYRQLTTFYSYFSILYNKQRETNVAFRTKDWRRVMTNVFWIMMVGPVAGALLTGDWPEPEDEERDVDDWATWAASRFFFGLWSGVPILRDVAAGVQREVEGKFTGAVEAPFYRMFSEVKKPVEDAIKVAKGEEPSERWIKNTITPIGYFTGLPTGQVGQTTQYLADVADGSQNPDSLGDVIVGVAKGPQDDQE